MKFSRFVNIRKILNMFIVIYHFMWVDWVGCEFFLISLIFAEWFTVNRLVRVVNRVVLVVNRWWVARFLARQLWWTTDFGGGGDGRPAKPNRPKSRERSQLPLGGFRLPPRNLPLPNPVPKLYNSFITSREMSISPNFLF